MARSHAGAIIGLAALVAGCTTQLESRQGLTAAQLQSAPLDGNKGKLQLLSYNVPAAQFKITLKTRAAKCDATGGVLTTEVQATVETQYNAGERYSIDYSKLAAFTKITSVSTALYPNGTLKTINAEASDQTIETATAVVKLVASVAALAGKAAGATEDPRCTAWKKRQADTAPLKAAKDKVDAAIVQLITLAPDPDTAEEVAKKLAGLTAIRDGLAAKLTTIDGTGWSSADVLWPASPTAVVTLNTDVALPVPHIDQLHVLLTRVDETSTTAASFPPPDPASAPYGGLVWRQGYRAKLTIAWCGNGLEAGDTPWIIYASCPGGPGTPGSVLTTTTAIVPQAGPFFLIALHNGVGRNNTIGATFLQDGSIETAAYGDKLAIGNHVATAANDLATAAAAAFPNQSAKLAAQKSCLDAVDGLRKSQAALSDVIGGNGTSDAKFAAYAAKCLE